MFGSFRKHQKWIWILGVIIIIPSFVIFFTPEMEQGIGRSDPGVFRIAGKPVTIAGKPITLDQFAEAYRETLLSYFVRSGGREWPDADRSNEEALERDAVLRVFILDRIRDLGIEISDEAVVRIARERLGDFPFAEFEKQHLKPKGLTAEDFQRYIRNEAAIQQLVNVAGAPGKLLVPQAARVLYTNDYREFRVELALFSASNHLDQVSVTPEAIGKFYTNRMAEYRVPEQIVINHVEFPVSNYMAVAEKELEEMTNLNSQIDDFYFRAGTNAFRDTNDMVMSEEAAKDQIRELMLLDRARRQGLRVANEFATELYNDPATNKAVQFERLAAAKGYPVQTAPPFNAAPPLGEDPEPLEEMGFPTAFLQKARTLNEQNPVAFSPILGTNAVYVITFKEMMSGYLPPLDEVQEKLTQDYKQFEARSMAVTNGTNFHAIVTNGVAQGQEFSELAKKHDDTFIEVPPFSLSTSTLTNLDERLDLPVLQQIVSRLEVGEISRFIPTRQGGMIVHVKEQVPLNETRIETELPEFMARLRQLRQSDAFNQWFSKQAERQNLIIPQKEEPMPGAGPPAGG